MVEPGKRNVMLCLGVVAMGYGDTSARRAVRYASAGENGREVPIVGRVYGRIRICADLGPQAQDKAGAPVILWGEGLLRRTYR